MLGTSPLSYALHDPVVFRRLAVCAQVAGLSMACEKSLLVLKSSTEMSVCPDVN